MIINDDKKAKGKHTLIMEDRGSLLVSGVVDVTSFDENEILLDTNEGMLIVKGETLHINKLSVESGEVALEGYILSVEYSEHRPRGGGFFGKLFGS